MAYTNVWTTAAPLDTQAANQGAVDFRATKLDVMQRIASFGAGLLAARPTPEVTSANADWTGVMYWATDTRQTFRWSGAAWVDISTNVGGRALKTFGGITPAPVDTTLDTIYDYILPANTLGATGGFKVTFYASFAVTVQTDIWVSFAGLNVLINHFAPPGFNIYVEFDLVNITSASQSISYTYIVNGAVSHVSTPIVTGLNTAVDQHISVLCQKMTAGDVTNFASGIIALL